MRKMNGNELLKKLRRLARERQEQLVILNTRGKGSHRTLCYGDRRTLIKDTKKEIGKGLLNSMLNDLGLKSSDIEGL